MAVDYKFVVSPVRFRSRHKNSEKQTDRLILSQDGFGGTNPG